MKTIFIRHINTDQVKEVKASVGREFLKSRSWYETDSKGNPIKKSKATSK